MKKQKAQNKQPRKRYSPEYKVEALMLAENVGVAEAVKHSACTKVNFITGEARHGYDKNGAILNNNWQPKMFALNAN